MIKFLDLQKINAQYASELKQVASEVIDSGGYRTGDRGASFEKNLAFLLLFFTFYQSFSLNSLAWLQVQLILLIHLQVL